MIRTFLILNQIVHLATGDVRSFLVYPCSYYVPWTQGKPPGKKGSQLRFAKNWAVTDSRSFEWVSGESWEIPSCFASQHTSPRPIHRMYCFPRYTLARGFGATTLPPRLWLNLSHSSIDGQHGSEDIQRHVGISSVLSIRDWKFAAALCPMRPTCGSKPPGAKGADAS
jgi:hypothetical protein